MTLTDAVANIVLGFGPRPRLVYRLRDGIERVAIGRRGEPLQSLLTDILRTYPGQVIPLAGGDNGALAEFAAGITTSRVAARAMGIRKARFLQMAKVPEAVSRSLVFNDELQARMWRIDAEAMPSEYLLPEPDNSRTRYVDSETRRHKTAGHGIGKTEHTGRYTTRGKPILRHIGRELSFRGLQLRPYEHIPLRWTERQLIGLPVPGDWGTPNRISGNLKRRLQAHRVEPTLFLEGREAMAYVARNPSQPGLGRNPPAPAKRAPRRKAVKVVPFRREKPEPLAVNSWAAMRGPEFEFNSLPLAA